MNNTSFHFLSVWLAVALIVPEASLAEPVKLVNKSGREIQAEILSATEDSVVLHRASDGKSFTLKTSDLSDESQKVVSAWRADQPPPLTKDVSLALPIRNSKRGRILAFQIKLPEGQYNYPEKPESSDLSFKHEDGTFNIHIIPHELGKKAIQEELERIKKEYLSDINRDVLRLTPERRKELEPRSYVAFEKHGDFEGYFVARPGHQHCLGGEWTLIGKEYKIVLSTTPMYKLSDANVEIGPFRRKNIPAIIATLRISDSK